MLRMVPLPTSFAGREERACTPPNALLSSRGLGSRRDLVALKRVPVGE